MFPQLTILSPGPGNYPGAGRAALLNAGQQVFVWSNAAIAAGTASVAILLERQKSAHYPWGAGIEIAFSGAPGAFEVDVQGAEVDQDANYCQIGTPISFVNTTNVGRFDMVNYYPKFIRLFLRSIANPVSITAVITR